MIKSLQIFMQFMFRDAYIESKKTKDYFINYVLAYPIAFAIQSGYLQASTYFGACNPSVNTMMYTGNLILLIMLVAYKQNIQLLFDLESKKYINYQITLLSPFLVILEMILFTSILTFLITIPFLPVGNFIFPQYIILSQTSWIKTLIILYLGSLCCSAYFLLAAVILPSINDINTLWARANHLLISFGGFWIPWAIMNKYSPILGAIAYLNPLIYITEGLKGGVLGSTQFISFSVCVIMLIIFSILFTWAAWIIFKRRTDCL